MIYPLHIHLSLHNCIEISSIHYMYVQGVRTQCMPVDQSYPGLPPPIVIHCYRVV